MKNVKLGQEVWIIEADRKNNNKFYVTPVGIAFVGDGKFISDDYNDLSIDDCIHYFENCYDTKNEAINHIKERYNIKYVKKIDIDYYAVKVGEVKTHRPSLNILDRFSLE